MQVLHLHCEAMDTPKQDLDNLIHGHGAMLAALAVRKDAYRIPIGSQWSAGAAC